MPDLTPTDGMREEAQRYRDWKAEGRRGGTAVAARRATQILSGDPLSEDTVITMAAWFARHEVDKKAEGFSPGEEGYPSPGRVAWAAWGGDPGQQWATATADSIKADRSLRAMPQNDERPYPNEHAARLIDPGEFDRFRRDNGAGGEGVDFIYGIKEGEPVRLQAIRFDAERFTPAEARQWLEDHDHTAILFEEATGEKARELTAEMTVAQGMLYEALEEIADEVGAFSQADAHYMPVSPFADQGMACSNCAFYQGPAACQIVDGEIAPGALCKFWIIPVSKLNQPAPEPRTLTATELGQRYRDGLTVRRELTVADATESTADGLRFTFSSEEPVDRWFGREVLSHAPGAADLSRLQSGAPHLWNHNRDVVLGVTTGAEIGADRMGTVTTRWSPNTLTAGSEEAKRRADIEAGISRKVSFAYEIREAVDMGDGQILVTNWAALEVSTVSIPADNTVGHEAPRSRALDEPATAAQPERVATVREHVSAQPENMSTDTHNSAPVADPRVEERERIQAIQAICATHKMPEGMAADLIEAGAGIDETRAKVLDLVGKRGRELQPGGLHVETEALIGMDRKDLQRYSLMKALRYLADPTSPGARSQAGFELEISQECEKKYERSANGIWIPFDWMVARRDQTVGSFGKGGALVGTELLAGSFIDLLRNRSALLQSGITTLTGLTGNVDIPRKTAASQHYWIGEDVETTPSDVTYGLISSTPKTIASRVLVSRRALIQTTPDIENLTRDDMLESVAIGLDFSGLYGTGSGAQPLGLANVTGIGSVTLSGGASQVYPAQLGGGTHDSGDWADYIQLLGSCLAANVTPANFRYIMNATTMVGGMTTLRAAAAGADFIINDAGNIGRYPVVMSNQVQTNDVFGGVFSDILLNTWSGLDIVVDTLTQAAKGAVVYTVMQDVDWVCRRAASFARGT